jgi:hypothetical protein
MWPHPLRKWFASKNSQGTERRHPPRRWIPRLELLEDRLVPAGTNLWLGGSGDWSAGGSWSLGHAPQSDEDVQIANGATVTHISDNTPGGDAVQSIAVSGGSTLVLSGGSITVASTLDDAGGSFRLQGGNLIGATITAGSTFTGTGGTLTNVSIAGMFDLSSATAIINVSGSLTLPGGTIRLGDAPGNVLDRLQFIDNAMQTIDGSPGQPGTILLGGYVQDGLFLNGNSVGLTLGQNLTIIGAAGQINTGAAPFDNQGTITADPTVTGPGIFNNFISLTGTNWTNHGTIGARNGGAVNLLGSWSNSGTIDNLATVNFGGSFTTAGLGTVTGGGTVNLTGALDNSGATLRVGAAPLTGNWSLAGGTITGGSVQAADGAALTVTGFSSTLSGVMLDGTGAANSTSPLAMSGTAFLHVAGDLSLRGATLVLGDAPANFQDELIFQGGGPQAIDGDLANPGTIILGGYAFDGLVANDSTAQLTIGAHLTITGAAGRIDMGAGTFDNHGTITADPIPTGPNPFQNFIRLNGTGWTNHGMLGAQNGGTLTFAGSWSNSGTVNNLESTVNLGGSFTTAGLGIFAGLFTPTTGSFNLTGALDNTAAILRVGAAPLAGNWFLAGGTITGGSVQAASGSTLTVTGFSSTLSGVTLDGTGAGNSTSSLAMSGSAFLRVAGALTLSGATLILGDAAANFQDELILQGGPQTIDGDAANPGTIILGGYAFDGLVANDTTAQFTIGAHLTITGAAGRIDMGAGTFDNQGTITADPTPTGPNPFQNFIRLNGIGWTNHGTIGAQNGGTLTLAGSWSNSGTINDLATVNLGGTFTTANLGSITGNGTVNVTGTLDNTATTLRVGAAPLQGSWTLAGGTITGGSVQAAAGSTMIVTTTSSTLTGVTLDGTGAGNSTSPLDMHTANATLLVSGSLILGGATLPLGDAAGNLLDRLLFVDSTPQVIDGSAGNPGTILFGGYAQDGLFTSNASVGLTLGANLTITGAAGQINSGSVAFDNQGTIDADPSAAAPNPFQTTIVLGGTGWTNHGTLQAAAGGTLLTAGSGALVNSTVSGTGQLTNTGTLTLINATIGSALSNQGTLIALGTSAINGSLTTTSGSTLRVLGNNTGSTSTLTVASGFTNNGTIELVSQDSTYIDSLIVTSGTLTNSSNGQINSLVGTGGARNLNAQLDNHGTITISQPTTIGQSSAVHTNSGTINVNADLTVNSATSFSTTGTIGIASGRTLTIFGGAFNYDAGTLGGAGTLSLSITVAAFTPDFSNAQTTLLLDRTTLNGPGTLTNANTLQVYSSTIAAPLVNQGTLIALGGDAISGSFTTALNSTLRVLGNNTGSTSALTVASGFTNNGTIELVSQDSTYIDSLIVTSGTLTNSSNGQINSLVGTGGARNLNAQLDNHGTITISQPTTIGQSSAVHTNSGTINVNANLTISQATSFNNSGTSNIASGAVFTINDGILANFNGGTSTLTGGTYNIAGTFRFPGASIVTNSADIALIGSPPGIQDLNNNNALVNLATNIGSFTLTGGTVFSSVGDFSNQGAVTIDATGNPGTRLAVAGNYTQSAGTTTLVTGATLDANNGIGNANIESGSVLQGSGTVNGNLVNAGTAIPGSSTAVGSIAVTGNYTQSAAGTLNVKLAGTTTPGTDYDALAVTGLASLDGTIHTQALGAFQPQGADSYQVMTFAAGSGDFANRTGIAFSQAFLVEQRGATSVTLAAFANPIVVDNATDAHVAGKTSLREAIAAADIGSRLNVAVTITFAAGLAGDTLTLSQGPLEIGQGGAGTGAITIDGSALASPLAVSGNDVSQVFVIDPGTHVVIAGIGITGGQGITGGAIVNDGALTVTGDTFTGNNASGAGGAIWSDGDLTVAGSTFSNNSVTTGTGDGGGAIAVAAGSATISANNFVGNSVAAAVGLANSAGGAIVASAATTVQFNRFSGNTVASPGHGNAVAIIGGAAVTADDNWWLSNTGPAASDVVQGTGGVFAPHTVADFLLLSASANPNPLLVGSQATITAGFTTDSAGHGIAAANLGALAGLTASFAGNALAGSSLTGTPTTVQNGQASAIYHAGAVGGTDSVSATIDAVAVTSNISVQQAPTIASDATVTFTVGTSGSFTVQTTGMPTATLTESGALPGGVTFHDNGDGTATLTGTPAMASGSSYPLTITAHNGVNPDAQQSFTLVVDEAPSFTSTGSTTFRVGVDTPFIVTALGFPRPTFSATGLLPSGVGLVSNTDGTAILSGTAVPSTGAYVFTLHADNAVGSAVQSFTLTVIAPPTITAPPTGTFRVGAAGTFSISAAAGIPPTVTLTESGKLPPGLKFAAKNGTATIAGKPAANSGGSYPVTFTARSGPFQTTLTATLTVQQPTAITSAAATTLAAGQNASFLVKTTGFPLPTFSLGGATIPAGVSIINNGNGTATLTAPSAGVAAGSYTLTITAGNGIGTAASQTFILMVVQPPSLTVSGSPTLTVGQASTLSIAASAGVPAGPLTIKAIGKLPAGIALKSGGSGAATLTGTPAAKTGGSYPITLTVGSGAASASQTLTLVVDQPPAITSAAAATLAAGQSGSFVVKATGFPFPTFSLGGTGIPVGVSLVNNNNGTATLSVPSAGVTAGPYVLTIIAGNGVGTPGSQNFTLTVVQPPSLTVTGMPTFAVGQAGTLSIAASAGVPAGPLTIKALGKLPKGIALKSGGNGAGTLSGTPGKNTGGSYPITLTVGSGAASTSQTLTLVVDQAPAIIGSAATFTIGQSGTFRFTTTGFPAATLSESAGLPAGLTFHSNGDGTATLSGIPAAGDATGTTTLTITAANGIGTAATSSFQLTVVQSPVFTTVPTTTFTVGSAATFTFGTAGFPAPTYTVSGTLPKGITFTDNHKGQAALHGTAAAGTQRTYTLVVTASNGVLPAALQLFTLVVQ